MKRTINGREYEVIKEGSAIPFAFVPGGTRQICDAATNNHVLVALSHESVEDLNQRMDEQSSLIMQLRKELKDTQDELVKKDSEINKLTHQINFMVETGRKMPEDKTATENVDNSRPKAGKGK